MIFFVDSTESNRFGDAADQLACYLDMEVLRHAILLVVCNKQDKKGARGIQEMSDALRLGSIQGRNWSIVKCCALDDGEIAKVMDTLMVSTTQSGGSFDNLAKLMKTHRTDFP